MPDKRKYLLLTAPLGREVLLPATPDISIDVIPFTSTEATSDPALDSRIRALARRHITAVFTSGRAVEMVSRRVSPETAWTLFSTGNTTRKRLQDLFRGSHIAGTAGDATRLAASIVERGSVKEIIFFCGDHRRDELPRILKGAGIRLEEVVVYRTTQIPREIRRHYDGILFFSPMAVRSFFSLNKIGPAVRVYAIGRTTAREVRRFTSAPVQTADMPDKEHLTRLAIEELVNSKKNTDAAIKE